MSKLFWNDQWTTEIKQLGFTPVGKQLTEMILQAPLPFSIGVNGKWGSGKTSLMRYAMASLGGSLLEAGLPGRVEKEKERRELTFPPEDFKFQNVIKTILKKTSIPTGNLTNKSYESILKSVGYPILCVWFNPWQYQQDPNPLIPLLHEIRSQVGFWTSTVQKTWKISSVSIEAGLELLGKLPKLAGLPELSVSSIRKIGERHERENLEVITDAQRFNLHFQRAVGLLLGNGEKISNKGKYSAENLVIQKARRLVIFIDDLDRCEDAQIRHLLEAIKLYLSTSNCVFVLGLDRSAAERAICREREDKSEREAAEYVEKLFQATVNVPVCQDYNPFILEKMKQVGFFESELTEVVIQDRDNSPSFIKVVTDLLEPNPRKVKNFLNSFVIQWKARPKFTGPEEENDRTFDSVARKTRLIQFVMIHYLRLYHPCVFRLLEQDPNLFDIFCDLVTSGRLEANVPEVEIFYEEFEHTLLPDLSEKTDDVAERIKIHRRALLKDRRDILRGDKAFVKMLLPVFHEIRTMDDPSDIYAILFGRTVPETETATSENETTNA